jgi:RecJ-like exonuclease
MWQKCPLCNGSGVYGAACSIMPSCPTCRGQRIISEITGLPPRASEVRFSSTTTNVKSSPLIPCEACGKPTSFLKPICECGKSAIYKKK